MTSDQIREHNERVARLRQERSGALTTVRKAYEPVSAVKKQAGENMDFSNVTLFKGTDEEKQVAFGKALAAHDEAFKTFKACDRALKSELKAAKSEKKAEKLERKDAKRAKELTRAESWKGLNINFGIGAAGSEFDGKGFDWANIKVPNVFDTYNPKSMTKSQAYGMGQVINAQFGSGASKSYAKSFVEDVFQTKALGTNVNEQGGGWIPTEFYPVLTQLIEDHSTARKLLPVWPMKNRTLRAPRLNALTQVYGEDEKVQPTEGTFNLTTIELTARKFMGISFFPTELLEQSPMAIGEIVTMNYAMAMGKKESQCLFNGDGTSTYNKIKGLKNTLLAIDGTLANIAGLCQSTATTMGALTRTDVTTWMGLLPAYAYDLGTPVIVCNQSFYQTVLRGKAAISQSTFATEVVNGIPKYKFDGYDVIIAPDMPRTDSTSGGVGTIFAWFGVPALAAKLGDSRAYSMKVSDQFQFGSDQITYLASEIIGMVVHDMGSTITDTTNDTPYSPMVALATAGTLS